jgi:hypothetical protein
MRPSRQRASPATASLGALTREYFYIFTNEACGHALAHGNRRIVGETTKPR